MPNDDMRLLVPNARLRMIIPFRAGLVGKKDGKLYIARTHKIALVGMSDSPSVVDAESDGPVGIAGVEFNSIGAYRFFRFNLKSIANQLFYLSDLLSSAVCVLEEELENTPGINAKIGILQRFLVSLCGQTVKDELFEYCIRRIIASEGDIRVGELERQTGYSGRWLNMKFDCLLGMSPKNLSSIVRFQQHYLAMISNPAAFFSQRDFFDHYHDGSHFVKDFKRFTGFAPSRIIQLKNEFGKTFHQEQA